MLFSAAHNCLIYDVPSPGAILASISSARQLSPSQVIIPADLFSLQLARVVGLPVPEIMDLAGYDWPIQPGRQPWRHQKHMANFMALSPRCLNLSDMGVGKTDATLWAADYLLTVGAIHKVLIISPLSTLKAVWESTIFNNFLGRRRCTVLHGERQERLKRLADPNWDFAIINHDGLGIGSRRGYGHRGMALGPIAWEIAQRPDIDCVIIDEATAYKDAGTLRSKVLRLAIKDKPYVWLLTGTPTPNAPTDAWGLAKIVNDAHGEPYRSFDARTMVPITQFKRVPRPGAQDAVNKLLQPSIRFSREECIDLPDCVVETRDVEMSPTQEGAYRTLKKELALSMAEGSRQITAMNEAVLRLKLIQIACGAVYGPDKEVHRTDAKPRLDELKAVISEAGGKILVFVGLTSCVNLLYSELGDEFGDKAVARIYGGTSQGQRAEIFRAFQNEANPRVIVADPGTMAHGINLNAANTIVWFGPTDRAETFQQANARINRPGQVRKMLIVRLVSTPVEREIYRRLDQRESLQGAILKLAEEGR